MLILKIKQNHMSKHESSVISLSNKLSLESRARIFELMNNYPSSDEEKERSLFLFLRSSLMARLFATKELYEIILDKPGIIFDIGTWRGQTAVICENLRAILEPLNFYRRIVAFDTFVGYKGFSEKDLSTNLHKDGTYSVEEGYEKYLSELLILHEKSNAMGHNFGKHKVIKGDCTETIPTFFEENTEEYISLAFFDVNSFEPTLKAFNAVYEKLIPGGVLAFWQMARGRAIPAEGNVYANEIMNNIKHKVKFSKFYPSLCYIIKD